MAIIQTLSFNQFARAFEEYGRDNQFSQDALRLIYDYLFELDENIELDVIGTCCDFVECYAEEAINYYGVEIDPEDYFDPEEVLEEVSRQLERNTTVLGVTDDEEAPTVVFVSY
jgi:hypothetical protein